MLVDQLAGFERAAGEFVFGPVLAEAAIMTLHPFEAFKVGPFGASRLGLLGVFKLVPYQTPGGGERVDEELEACSI